MKKTDKTPTEIVADVVQAIRDEAVVRPLSDQIPLYFSHPIFEYVETYKVNNILEKLRYDFGVIKKFIAPPSFDFVENPPEPTDEHPEIYNAFYIEVTENFDYWSQDFINNNRRQTENEVIPEKLNAKALSKIWSVLQEIEEKRQISPASEIGIVEYTHDRSGDPIDANIIVEAHRDRLSILNRLSSQGAIRNIRSTKDNGEPYWSFFITDKYMTILNDYENKYHQAINASSDKTQVSPELKYEIYYTPNREILLDNKYLLLKPNFNSENEVVFSYIFANQNRKISRDEIETKTKIKLSKALPDIVEKLGFKGDLKKVFFSVSSDAVEFRNPVTKEMLSKLGIERIKL